MSATIRFEGLDDQVRRMLGMPGNFQRAKRSAMSSLGWFIRQMLANHIEYGGEGWAPLRALTLRLKKSGAQKDNTPLFWLGRFARYRIGQNGDYLQVGFGKSRAAADAPGGLPQEGSFDPALDAMVRRHEYGASEPVGANTQAHVAAQFWKGKRSQKTRSVILKKSTTSVRIPPRPMVRPVLLKIEPDAVRMFEEKFIEALARYETGGKK